MDRRRIRHISALTMLCMSVALLSWAIASNWIQREGTQGESNASARAKPAELRDSLPPPLDSRSVKASLHFPAMRARGPQPSNDLIARPLVQNAPSKP